MIKPRNIDLSRILAKFHFGIMTQIKGPVQKAGLFFSNLVYC